MKPGLAGCLITALFIAPGCDDSAPSAVSDTSDAPDSPAAPDAPNSPDVVVSDATSSDDTSAGPSDPLSRGPWQVGHRVETITYTPADGSPVRSLRVVYWYPTTDTTGDEVLYAGLLPAENVFGNAALAAHPTPYPRFVFSHGNTSFAEQSHFLTTFLASHGFVVAAPDHTGNTFGVREVPVEIFHWRPLDLSAVMDHLDTLAPPHFLAGRLSPEAAVSGHSFGGYTALAATGAAWDVDGLFAFCEQDEIPLDGCNVLTTHEQLYRNGFDDPRFSASIPMTPGATFAFGTDGSSQVNTPTLLFTGSLDRTTTNEADGDPTWAALSQTTDHIRVNFRTGGHFTFSDACTLPIAVGENDGCGPDFVPFAEAHRAINAITLAFLRRHIYGDESGTAILSGELVLSDDIELRKSLD